MCPQPRYTRASSLLFHRKVFLCPAVALPELKRPVWLRANGDLGNSGPSASCCRLLPGWGMIRMPKEPLRVSKGHRKISKGDKLVDLAVFLWVLFKRGLTTPSAPTIPQLAPITNAA